ncbi:MAG: RipA family octameric membrane protein [Flavisolibacter sp.]
MLNTEKFKVLHELENQLPFTFFQKEWNLIKSKKHIAQSTIEKLVPGLFIMLYTAILVYSIIKL